VDYIVTLPKAEGVKTGPRSLNGSPEIMLISPTKT